MTADLIYYYLQSSDVIWAGDGKVEILPCPILKAARRAGARLLQLKYYYILLVQNHAYFYIFENTV